MLRTAGIIAGTLVGCWLAWEFLIFYTLATAGG